jgi:hypothetical protein
MQDLLIIYYIMALKNKPYKHDTVHYSPELESNTNNSYRDIQQFGIKIVKIANLCYQFSSIFLSNRHIIKL